MVLLSWMHPVLGRIEEIVCPRHEREVLKALDTLGIGAIGERAPYGDCLRCLHGEKRVRDFLEGMDMVH
jgi:hypothetical protein